MRENISIQIKAGAEVVMIFDSAANQLNKLDFAKYIKIVFEELVMNFNNKVGYYAKDGVDYSLIEKIKKESLIPLAGLGIDSNHSLGNYFSDSREGFIQGNFDEIVMTQPQNIMEKKLEKFIEETSSFSVEQRVGWVCGLGHGVLKTTPEDNIRLFVKKIRESFA